MTSQTAFIPWTQSPPLLLDDALPDHHRPVHRIGRNHW